MAKIQVKNQNSARLRSSPTTFSDQNIIGSAPGSTFIENATLNEDQSWYELPPVYIHVSTVNVLVPDVVSVDPTPTPSVPLPNTGPLKVPYRSQWDVDANNRTADCGQTCVAMLAQWKGVNVKINDLRFQSQPSGLSSSQDLVNNLHSIGIQSSYMLIDPPHMGVNDVMIPPELLNNLPAICLVSYNGFDRASVQDRKYNGWHWLILLQDDVLTKQVVVNDPDFWAPQREQGNKKHYSYAEWNKAFIPSPGSGGKLQFVHLI